MEEYKVIVVGGGPAGIFTIYTLIENGLEGNQICLIEKGPSSKKRDSYSIEGFGGAGLFSDVKLCMRFDTGSLLPEIYFKEYLDKFKQDENFREKTLKEIEFAKYANHKQILYSWLYAKSCKELIKTFEEVKEIFSNVCEKTGIEKDFYNLYLKDIKRFEKEIDPILREENLDISSYYPVIHLGSDQGRKVIEEFEKYFKEYGVELKFNTEIASVKKENKKFKVADSKENIYISDILVLAVGKGGSNKLMSQLEKMGVEKEEGNCWIGVRVETKKNDLNKLTKYLGDDPKIKWPKIRENLFEDWTIKLHCFVEGGEVISYPWENITLVGGKAESRRNRENTNFDILYSDRTLSTIDVKKTLKKFEKSLRVPIIQRFEDYLKNTQTENLNNNSIKPTLKRYKTGNVREFLSKFSEKFTEKLPLFMEKINKLYTGILNYDTLIYFPVIEWGSERIKVTANMETNIENLYAIGDGAGITQGIIASAISGVIAGKNIFKKILTK